MAALRIMPRPVVVEDRHLGDFEYLYRLRFGYFIGGDSGSGPYHHHHGAKPGAMHQGRVKNATIPEAYIKPTYLEVWSL